MYTASEMYVYLFYWKVCLLATQIATLHFKINMFKLNPPLIYETKLQSVKEKWYNKLYCSKIKSHTKKSKPISVASRC